MEEADARLQEVVASLLNEYGGNHEAALRQTFACLHNSGLYEAQSPQEEEQREQQVLSVFRSFPFRNAASVTAPITSADIRVEDTQAPAASYETGPHHTSAHANSINNSTTNNSREPEEAGEVAVEGDPENVGEYPNSDLASATAGPEALPPIYPVEAHGEDSIAPGPEFSHQQLEHEQHQQQQSQFASAEEQVPDIDLSSSLEEIEEDPEGSMSAPRTAAGVVHTGGNFDESGPGDAELSEVCVVEASGDERGESDHLGASTGGGTDGLAEVRTDAVAEETVGGEVEAERVEGEPNRPSDEAYVDEAGAGLVNRSTGDVLLGNGIEAECAGVEDDPESTTGPLRQFAATSIAAPQRSLGNGYGDPFPSSALNGDRPDAMGNIGATATASEAEILHVQMSTLKRENSSADCQSSAVMPLISVVTAGKPSRVEAFTGEHSEAVCDPHLKTGGHPLTYANRAESPTAMSPALQLELKQLKLRRKHRFLVMRIDGTEVVEAGMGAPTEGLGELKAALPYSDCRYAVYDQEITTSDGRKTSKLFFFTWLPHNATPHNKMAYSHGKVTVRQRLEGMYDVAASSFEDIESALGLVESDEEDSDIDF